MLQINVIGNLGGDARVMESNGRKFVSFNVAHTERWADANGNVQESTIWVSCAMDGDGGKLLPYLKTGKSVYVQGRGSLRVYSSPKTHKMEAGLNVSVSKVELIGGSVDSVPRELHDTNGEVYKVNKMYWVPMSASLTTSVQTTGGAATLYDKHGTAFAVDAHGVVTSAETKQEDTTYSAAGQTADMSAGKPSDLEVVELF